MAVAARRRSLDPARRPRSGRRRGLLRLLVLVTALLLTASAVRSIVRSSRTAGPDERVVYVDQVRPTIDASTRQGAALNELRNGPTHGADGLRRSTERLAAEAKASYAEVVQVDAPAELDASRGLLLASLRARQAAVERIATALVTLSADAPTDPVIEGLIEAGRDLSVSDRAYELFAESLPAKARSAAPASTWVGDSDAWDRASVAAFIASLRASASVSPIHDVGLITVIPTPTPVGKEGENEILPQTKTLSLQVVVANVGNAAEKRVAVEAVATSAGGMNVARQFVDLAPGQRRTVTLALKVAPGDPITVTVKVGAVSGETNLSDNEVQPPLRYIRR